MFVTCIIIGIGSIVIACLSYLVYYFSHKNQVDDLILTCFGVAVAVVVTFVALWFHEHSYTTVEGDFEYHIFKDRVIVVGHGIMKEYTTIRFLECFEKIPNIKLQLNWNVFGSVVEEEIITSCEEREELLREKRDNG